MNNDIAPNGRVLDKNGTEIKSTHWDDKVLGSRELLISLYDIAQNELKIIGLSSFISKIDELIYDKTDF